VPKPQVVPHCPPDRRRTGGDTGGHRWFVVLAGFVGVAALTLPGARVLAQSLTGRHPTGSVQLEADGADVGGPGTLNAVRVATTTAAFAADASAALSAASVPVSVTVPPAGSFIVTVTAGTVTLAVQGGARNAARVATGTLQAVTVSESRNYLPGWSVTGQASNLTVAGQPILGTQLGWIPAGTVTGGAKLGPPVGPGRPGLGSVGGVLAAAAPGTGLGTDTLFAELMLAVPPGAQNGPYAGTVTITFVETGA
jgi:hypothetical protein